MSSSNRVCGGKRCCIIVILAAIVVVAVIITVAVLVTRKSQANHTSKKFEQLPCVRKPSAQCLQKWRSSTLQLKESGRQYFINGSIIVTIESNVPKSHRMDLLNAMKLADLASATKHNPFTDASSYDKEFTSVLSNTGWVITSSTIVNTKTNNAKMQVDNVAIKAFSDSEEQVRDVLNVLPQESNICEWKDFSCDGCAGAQHFRLIVVRYSSGNTIASIGVFRFRFTSCKGKWLSETFDSGNVEYSYNLQTAETPFDSSITSAVAAKLNGRGSLWEELQGN